MNTNLLTSITNQLTPQMIQKASSSLGETPGQTQTAVDGAIPSILAGLIHFAALPKGATDPPTPLHKTNYESFLNTVWGWLGQDKTPKNMKTAGQEILRVVFAD